METGKGGTGQIETEKTVTKYLVSVYFYRGARQGYNDTNSKNLTFNRTDQIKIRRIKIDTTEAVGQPTIVKSIARSIYLTEPMLTNRISPHFPPNVKFQFLL